ncbi:MOB kinase activator 3C [Sciurus carolinensis]|uniref:MOB kinase activator 3C n=1 Tax=Sciurus carolinensis TaxID=30640 RepID=A0AA41N605_SCICA|nr:MOB kinase activator 3C [Sciurus carolinensis]
MALCLKQVFGKDQTFRPRKRFEPGTQRFELHKKAQLPPIDDWIAVHVVDFFTASASSMAPWLSAAASPAARCLPRTRRSGHGSASSQAPSALSCTRRHRSLKSVLDLRIVVELPPINDWIAVHVVDFFTASASSMAPWLSAAASPAARSWPTALLRIPLAGALLMDWTEGLVNDEDAFPPRAGVPFPKNFQQVYTKILALPLPAHVYIHHLDSILSMGAEAPVDTCYKHFRFSPLDQRELESLREMTEQICH